MNWQDVLDLLAQGENQHTEFIGQAVDSVELAQIIVGMANAEGGQIILGLDDKNRYFIGTDLSREFIEKLNAQLCQPPVKLLLEVIEHEGKNLIVITISGTSQKPYACEDIYYLREDTVTHQASFEEIQRFHGVPFVPPLKPPRPGQTKISGTELNDRQKKLFEYLKNQPRITNRQYRLLYDVSHKTAHQELTQLAQLGHLKTAGAGRSAHYTVANRSSDHTPPLQLLQERAAKKPSRKKTEPAFQPEPEPAEVKPKAAAAEEQANEEEKVDFFAEETKPKKTPESKTQQGEMFPAFPKVFPKKGKRPTAAPPPLPDNYLD